MAEVCDRICEVCLYLLFLQLPFSKAATEIFSGIAIFAYLIKKFCLFNYHLKRYFSDTLLIKPLGVFILWNVLIVIFSINFKISIIAFLGKILEYIFLYIIVVDTIRHKAQLRNILFFCALSVIIVLTDVFFQYFTGRDFVRGYMSERLTASFGSPNGLASWLSVMVMIALGLFFARNNFYFKNKNIPFLLSIVILLLIFSLLFTFSRGGWLGLFGGIMFFFFSYIKRTASNKKNRIIFKFLILAVILCFFFLLQPAFKSRILTSEGSALVRINLWKEALSISSDFPLFGTGLNTYSKVVGLYKMDKTAISYAHNSYLQMAAETGLMGLFSFLWLVGAFFKLTSQNFKKTQDMLLLGLMGGIFAFLIQSFFDNNLYSLRLAVMFWFVLGLAVAKIRIEGPLPHKSVPTA